MALLFQDILKAGIGAGVKPRTQDAFDWFRRAALAISKVSPQTVLGSAEPFRRMERLSINSIGKMYIFNYDPKWKATLPYYDRWPLIFPIEYYPDGFLGINLHYLPPVIRAKLMDALMQTMNNKKYDKTTKLIVSYKILKSAAQFHAFKPCVKRYLASHVQSLFMYVAPDEWNVALMLPFQRFVKADETKIWADSMEKINKI